MKHTVIICKELWETEHDIVNITFV